MKEGTYLKVNILFKFVIPNFNHTVASCGEMLVVVGYCNGRGFVSVKRQRTLVELHNSEDGMGTRLQTFEYFQ